MNFAKFLRIPFLQNTSERLLLNRQLMPEIVNELVLPEDFPVPCNCLKCVEPNLCPCRVSNILAANFSNVKLKNYVKKQIKFEHFMLHC